MPDISAVILAAGRGVRMNSELPKVLHVVHGKSILEHVLNAVEDAGIRKIFVIVGHGERQVRAVIGSRAKAIRQARQLGTGHAVLCAKSALASQADGVLILPGDAPCIRAADLGRLVAAHAKGAGATVLTANLANPSGYGRIVKRGGKVLAIREELDASAHERRITEVNSGVYLFRAPLLFRHLTRVRAENKKKEYYLTDVIASLAESGIAVGAVTVDSAAGALGINSRTDLRQAGKLMNQREIEKHERNGVTIVSPDNTFIAADVRIGRDTVIYPFSWIERNVVIGKKCAIGPFANLRANSKVEDGAVVGSFVEVTRSRIGKNARVKHLSYIGDSDLGPDVNVGAGTVTANYDGARKSKTVVGAGAFIGSNSVLVAPLRIGKKAKTGAGAVVLSKSKVPNGATVVGVPARVIRKGKFK